MSDTTISLSSGARNRNRFFNAARTIALVRFDPQIKDTVPTIRDEQTPTTNPRGGKTAPIVGPHLAQVRANIVGPQNVASSVGIEGRTAAAALNANLGDVLQSQKISSDGLSRFLDIQPMHSSLKRNSFRLADELELKIAWKDVPFDARIIRAILVFHYQGTVSASNFSSGFSERTSGSSIPTGYLIPAVRSNLRFMGVADEFKDSHGEGGDWITLKARDLTALLIDAKISPLVQRDLKPGTTILETVAALLDTLPTAEIIRGPFALGPVAAFTTIKSDSYPRNAKSAKRQHQAAQNSSSASASRKASKEEGESYWDAITELCLSHGLIASIELDQLVIQPARTFFTGDTNVPGASGEQRFPTPIRQRYSTSKDSTRTMVYGLNVLELDVERKLGRIKAPTIEVRAVNPDNPDAGKRLIKVQYPPAARATSLSADGRSATNEIQVHAVSGITDKTLLENIAQTIYEAVGRNEFGIRITTNDPSSLGPTDSAGRVLSNWDPNADPDLLDLRAGDPIRLLVTPTERGRGTLVSINDLGKLIADSQGLSVGQGVRAEFTSAVARLVSLGWARDDATQLVKVLSTANLPTIFRTSSVTVVFDGEQGSLQIDIEMKDYARVRADPYDPSGTTGVGNNAVGLPASNSFRRPPI